jgi:hypothetical protein
VSSCTYDIDTAFESWFETISILMEIVLGADGSLDCMRLSSMPEMAWLLMAAYLLINVISASAWRSTHGGRDRLCREADHAVRSQCS